MIPQLMDQDLLGTRRFAVVRDDFEQHQVGGPEPRREGVAGSVRMVFSAALDAWSLCEPTAVQR